MSVPTSFQRVHKAGLIAVVRADRPEQAVRVAGALLAGGVWAIELTFTTPGAAEALAEVRALYGQIDASTIRTWFAAGALAVGAGGELVPRTAIEAGDWDEITRRAKRFADATRSARVALQAQAG